jgi:hypothetical protein
METHGWVVTVVDRLSRHFVARIGYMNHPRLARTSRTMLTEAMTERRPGDEAEKQNSK